MGVAPLAAHMFVFYFACLSNITPPVALASFTAAGLCGAPPFAVAWESIRLALSGFIVPFIFCYSPQLLLIDAQMPYIFINIITASIGAVALSTFTSARSFFVNVTWFEKILFLACAFLLIDSGFVTDAIGLVCLLAAILLNYVRSKNKRRNAHV